MTAFAPSSLATAAFFLTVTCTCAQPAKEAPVAVTCVPDGTSGICAALKTAMLDSWQAHVVTEPNTSNDLKQLQLTYTASRDVTNGMTGKLLWTLSKGPATEAKGESPELGMIIMDRPLQESDIQDFARQLVGATEFPFSQ